MVYCRHCNTEYGGIRGITADKCPRCVAREETTDAQSSISSVMATPAWSQPQLASANWSMGSASLQSVR